MQAKLHGMNVMIQCPTNSMLFAYFLRRVLLVSLN